MPRKASEIQAEPTQLAERLDPVYTEIVCREEGKPDIRIRLRPLTYIQRVYCDSVRVKGGSAVNGFDPNSIAEYVQWVLRFGIDSAEGVDWQTERTRVASRDYQLVKLESLDLLPSVLQDAAFGQISALTELSESEKKRVDFTSPLHEADSLNATASAA